MLKKKLLIPEFELPSMATDSDDIQRKLGSIRNIRTTTGTQNIIDKSFAGRLKLIKENVELHLGKFKSNTEVIWSKERFHNYITNAIEQGVIAIDTETNMSLDPLTCKLMGVCLYSPQEKAAYIPVNHENYITEVKLEGQLTEKDVKEEFERLVNTKIIMHNSKFDIEVLLNTCDIRLKCYWDTLIASKLVNDYDQQHSLKWQYADKCDSEAHAYNIETFFKGVNYAWVPPDVFALYAATDSYCTNELYMYQVRAFKDKPNVYDCFMNIEMPILDVVTSMEMTGINFDYQLANKLGVKYRKKLVNIEAEIYKITNQYKEALTKYRILNPTVKLDDPILLSSSNQIAILLYDIMGLPMVDERMTGEATLLKLNKPITKLMLEHRGVIKLLNAFIESLPKKTNSRTKKIHAKFNSVGTDTGRFSSSEPKRKLGLMLAIA